MQRNRGKWVLKTVVLIKLRILYFKKNFLFGPDLMEIWCLTWTWFKASTHHGKVPVEIYIWQHPLQNELSLGIECSVPWIQSFWPKQISKLVARLYLYSKEQKPHQFFLVETCLQHLWVPSGNRLSGEMAVRLPCWLLTGKDCKNNFFSPVCFGPSKSNPLSAQEVPKSLFNRNREEI